MADQLVRAITADGMVKATAVSTRLLTERARQIHRTLPVATAALGRTMAAASMLGNARFLSFFTRPIYNRSPIPSEDGPGLKVLLRFSF